MKWIPTRSGWILVLAGFCLFLLQFFMIREVTALLRGTEIVILLITLAYFTGYSVGYGVAARLSFRVIQRLALVTWIVHLTLPFSFRYLGGFLTLKAGGITLLAFLFVAAFSLSSFYSLLLPRLIDQSADGPQSLIVYYSLELAGATVGVLTLVLMGSLPWVVPVLYQVALATLVALLWANRFVWWLTCAGVAGYAICYSAAEKDSLNYRFATIHKFEGHEVLYSVNSIYQKVDIVRSSSGQRYLYLNGRLNYGSSALSKFNIFLSKFPATLLRPKEALILGSGSMESVKYVSEFAAHVTTCEIDSAVIAGSRRYLADINHLDQIPHWSLAISDAKRFLGNTNQQYDLIVEDIPAPLTIQVGLLHSVEFYQLVQKRLAPRGMISVSLSGTFSDQNQTPCTVAAALLKVFKEVLIYTPRGAGRSFALAGNSLPFTRQAFVDAGIAVGAPEIDTWERAEAVEIVGGTRPITVDDMSFVVRRSWRAAANL